MRKARATGSILAREERQRSHGRCPDARVRVTGRHVRQRRNRRDALTLADLIGSLDSHGDDGIREPRLQGGSRFGRPRRAEAIVARCRSRASGEPLADRPAPPAPKLRSTGAAVTGETPPDPRGSGSAIHTVAWGLASRRIASPSSTPSRSTLTRTSRSPSAARPTPDRVAMSRNKTANGVSRPRTVSHPLSATTTAAVSAWAIRGAAARMPTVRPARNVPRIRTRALVTYLLRDRAARSCP